MTGANTLRHFGIAKVSCLCDNFLFSFRVYGQ